MKIITKQSLFLRFIRRGVRLGVIFGALFAVGLFIVDFVTENSVDPTTFFYVFVICILTCIISFFISPAPDFYWLRKQEKLLGFCFNVEMEKHNVTELPYVSNQWFIVAAANRVIAYNRNYIVRLDNERAGHEEAVGIIEEITITSADGEKRKIRAGTQTDIVPNLKKWIELGEVTFE